MKCPKCHYLSFDPEPRCRNCGYTLALDPDLAIHPEPAPEAPLADLALRDPIDAPVADAPPKARAPRRRAPSTPPEPPRPRTTAPGPFDVDVMPPPAPDLSDAAEDAESLSLFEAEADEVPQPPAPAPTPSRREDAPRERRPQPPPPPTSELPLFVKGMGAEPAASPEPPAPVQAPPDLSLRTPVVAAPPLSVRRPADVPLRSRETDSPKFGPLDRDLLEGLQRIEYEEKRQAVADARQVRTTNAADATRRLGAAAIDALLLGGIAAGVSTATLRWVGLDWAHWTSLPVTPLLAFTLLIVVGYLFMFTAASGQTAGKMVMGIRVVDAGPDGIDDQRVSVRQALYRSALTVPSVCLAGLGFLPALAGERRALHDRLTETRVVRA